MKSNPSIRTKCARSLSIPLVFAATILFGCGSSQQPVEDPEQTKARLQENLSSYGELLVRSLATLQSSDDVEEIREGIKPLVDRSVPIIDDYKLLHPESREYLRAAKTALHRLRSLTEDAIEREYHEGIRLPERPDDGGTAYHVKDLLVHPATVLILLRDGDLAERRADMIHEIERTQSHLNAVLRAVGATN